MGPLKGVKIIELGGIGPGPFCGMMLSDMGAEVIRVEKAMFGGKRVRDVLTRGRKSIAVDLKSEAGKEVILKLCEGADAMFEGFRPGVTERLGLGPDECLARNRKLVYGRMTGWGQDGPMAQAAGHDINYIALSGALSAIGNKDGKPVVPLNLVGDFGGGGMMLAFGIVCAILEAQKSGKGQVVDTSMVDGSAILMSMFYSLTAAGMWNEKRGSNLLDGGAHFYNTYETRDGKYISIGSIERQFYALLIEKVQLDPEEYSAQMDPSRWEDYKDKLSVVFKTRTRAQWCDIMEDTDICFAPVLSLAEAAEHPHNVARKTFTTVDDILQPSPAPRFSRTVPEIRGSSRIAGEDTESVLRDAGFHESEIETMLQNGTLTSLNS